MKKKKAKKRLHKERKEMRALHRTMARERAEIEEQLLRDVNIHIPRYTLVVKDGKDKTQSEGGALVDAVFQTEIDAERGSVYDKLDTLKNTVLHMKPRPKSIHVILGVRFKRS